MKSSPLIILYQELLTVISIWPSCELFQTTSTPVNLATHNCDLVSKLALVCINRIPKKQTNNTSIHEKAKAIQAVAIMYLALLKGHCRGDFAVFWSKQLKYLTKNFFPNMILLFEGRKKILR